MSAQTKPPEFIPNDLHERFTMFGSIPVEYCYMDESTPELNSIVYEKETVDTYVQFAKEKRTNYYGATDLYLYQALEAAPVRGKEIGIVGSRTPWYESIAIAYGGHPTAIDYNKIISKDPRIKSMSVEEYETSPVLFDALFSISSIEHDGLGRYGDPITPIGDILAMKKAKKMLKKGGLLFLAIPVGKDRLYWNSRRVYGAIRLPMLLEGWELLQTFGFSTEQYNMDLDGTTHQPLFLCRNTSE